MFAGSVQPEICVHIVSDRLSSSRWLFQIECATGTQNRPLGAFTQDSTYDYRSFCDVFDERIRPSTTSRTTTADPADQVVVLYHGLFQGKLTPPPPPQQDQRIRWWSYNMDCSKVSSTTADPADQVVALYHGLFQGKLTPPPPPQQDQRIRWWFFTMDCSKVSLLHHHHHIRSSGSGGGPIPWTVPR